MSSEGKVSYLAGLDIIIIIIFICSAVCVNGNLVVDWSQQ
jgi:hypothetical protein